MEVTPNNVGLVLVRCPEYSFGRVVWSRVGVNYFPAEIGEPTPPVATPNYVVRLSFPHIQSSNKVTAVNPVGIAQHRTRPV